MTVDRTGSRLPRNAGAAALSIAVLFGMMLAAGGAEVGRRARINALRNPPVTHVVIDTINDPPPAPALSRDLPDPATLRPAGTPPLLHIEGNRVVGPDGRPVRLRGVNIASLEWTDTGENVARSLAVAVDDWGCNLVRIPLSQDRWFGRAPTQSDDGAVYRSIVDGLVRAAAQRGVYVILDLHWNDVGVWGKFIGQHRMPDPGSLLFWKDVARRYANHPSVLMGVYNEPHDIDWDVWLNGGELEEQVPRAERHDPAKPLQRIRTTVRYRAVGHQELYDAVRAAGATDNIIVIGGLDWAYDLAGLLHGHAVRGANILYDTHVYPNKDWKPELSWENAFLKPSQTLPVLVGEWGGSPSRDGQSGFVEKFVQCLRDNPQFSWTAWDLHPSAGPTLIRNWDYEPTELGEVVMEELKRGR
jgi:endoglucanase